jgi:nitrogen fixation/metabolism regulation signal transduction histidine kinase
MPREKNKMTIIPVNVTPSNLGILADQELIDAVLINLFKNAVEVVANNKHPTIGLRA